MPTPMWNYLNKLPAEIRRKTTPENKALFDILMEAEKEKNITHNWNEINELIENDESLYYSIKEGYHYSTLSGVRLTDYVSARSMYKIMLEHGSLDFANTATTVYVRDAWRMLKDVHKEL